MKHLHYILIFLIAAMFSCRRHSYSPMLVAADSLCNVNVDSALSILDKAKPAAAAMCAADRWYYRLLCVKTADKAYIRHTSPTEIEAILHYYENGGDSRMLPEAYFYAGSVYRDLDNAPQAVEYYQKALECMPGKRGRLKSNTYNQLGKLYVVQGLFDYAIQAYKASYDIDVSLRDTVNMIYGLRDMSFVYDKKGDKDSCEQILRYAIKIVDRCKNIECRQSLFMQLAGMSAGHGHYKEALDYLNRCDLNSGHIDRSANYSIAASVYMGLRQYDIARTYCDSLLEIGMIHAKKVACKRLIKIYSETKEYNKMVSYIDKYEMYCDSVYKINAHETVAHISASYDYGRRIKEIARLKVEKARYLVIFISVALLLVLCTCVVLYRLYKARRKNERQRELFNKLRRYQYERTCEYMDANQREISSLEQQIALYKDKNTKLVARLEEQRVRLIADKEKSKIDLEERELSLYRIHGSVIYNVICNKIKISKPLSFEEWDELYAVVDANIKDFKTRLYDIYSMSDHEYNICILIKIGVSIKDISILVGRSFSAITMSRKRLYTKMLGKIGHPSDFDDFIKLL